MKSENRISNSNIKGSRVGIQIRRCLHPLVYKLFFLLKVRNFNVKSDFDGKDPVLFVGNHLCIDDIPTLAIAVKKHTFVLVSDEDKYTLSGLALEINGVVWIKRVNKESRLNASHKVCQLLEQGHCVTMFPESTWNLSPNRLILPLNWGCIKIALQSQVSIVPVVTLFKQDTSYTHVGVPYIPSNDVKKSVVELRDIMATMQYNLIQQYYRDHQDKPNIYSMVVDGEVYFYEKLSEIQANYWSENIQKRYSKYKRSKKHPLSVRIYESQFIFDGKGETYDFFKIWNSTIRFDKQGNILIKRITSEKGGYCDPDYSETFGCGYNENYRLQI